MNTNKSQIIFFGSVIFIWLTISSICYTLFLVFRDLMIIYDIDATLNIIISNILYLIIFTLLIYWAIKNLKMLLKMKAFLFLVTAFFIIQILQFFYTLYFYEYIFEIENIYIYKYFDQVKNFNIKYYSEVVCDILKYAISAILIFYFSRKSKLIS